RPAPPGRSRPAAAGRVLRRRPGRTTRPDPAADLPAPQGAARGGTGEGRASGPAPDLRDRPGPDDRARPLAGAVPPALERTPRPAPGPSGREPLSQSDPP